MESHGNDIALTELDNVKTSAIPTLEYTPLIEVISQWDCVDPMVLSYLRYKSKERRVHLDYLITVLLTFVGASVGKRCKVHFLNYLSNLSLMVNLVGRSGANKSQAYKALLKPITERNTELVTQSDKEYYEYLDKTKNSTSYVQKPHQMQILTNDTTPEAMWDLVAYNDVLDIHDELSSLFANNTRYTKSNDEMQKRMSCYDGSGTFDINRVDREKNLHIKDGFLSTLGTMQPKPLKKYFGGDNLETGFTQRWLFSFPERCDIELGGKTPQDFESHYNDIITSYYHEDFNNIDNMLEFDDSAQRVVLEFDKFVTRYVNQIEDAAGLLSMYQASYVDKTRYTFAKTAGIIHLIGLDRSSKYISFAEAKTAVGITRHFMFNFLNKVLPIIVDSPKKKKITQFEAIRTLQEEIPDLCDNQLAQVLHKDRSTISKIRHGKL